MKKILELGIALFFLFSIFFISMFMPRDIISQCEQESCYLELAKENLQSEYCSSSSHDSRCYYYYALYVNDVKYCSFEKNRELCVISYAISKGEKDLCLTLDEKNSFDCILTYSTLQGDISTCELLKENSSFCYYSYTLYMNDSKLCSLTGEYRDDCRRYFK